MTVDRESTSVSNAARRIYAVKTGVVLLLAVLSLVLAMRAGRREAQPVPSDQTALAPRSPDAVDDVQADAIRLGDAQVEETRDEDRPPVAVPSVPAFSEGAPMPEPLLHWTFDASDTGLDNALRMRARSVMESSRPVETGEHWTLAFWFRQENVPNAGGARNFAEGPLTLHLPGRPGRAVAVSVPGLGELNGKRVAAGDWEHVAVVARPGSAVLYVNGLRSDRREDASWRARAGPTRLRFQSVARHTFEGLLADVRLYNVALSADAVQALSYDVYHPGAAWLGEHGESMRTLIHAGKLSRARVATLSAALGAPNADAVLERLVGNGVSDAGKTDGTDAMGPGDLNMARSEGLSPMSVRRLAAWALGIWAYASATEPLMDALRDSDDAGLIQVGAQALERIVSAADKRGDADAVALLRRLRMADCGRIRSAALRALAGTELRNPDDFRAWTRDPDWRVRSVAMSALVALDTPVDSLSDGPDADWPMARYEPGRGAATPHALPSRLHLHWTLELPPPLRAWPAQPDDFDKLEFDLSYEPVVAGNTLYVGSMTDDSVTAYDLDSGQEQWRYVTDGPVRVPVAVWDGRVYAASDDGRLHCLDAKTGARLWTFRAAPSERKVLGNRRLISVWSARGGPVVQDGTVYFASGIWPFEGVFVCALDARDGTVRWINSSTGSHMDLHQHGGAYAFGGVAPQGALVTAGDRLLVPGGRTTPSVFDRHSGELLYFRPDSGTVGKGAGGYRVYARGSRYLNPAVRGNRLYDLADGSPIRMLDADVLSDGGFFGVENERVFVWSSDKGGDERRVSDVVEDLERLHVLADRTLYGSGYGGRVFALELGVTPDPLATSVWDAKVDGPVFRMLAARGRLLVVTESGRIHCFGAEPRRPIARSHPPVAEPLEPDPRWASAVAALAESGQTAGSALMFGIGSGRLLDTLLVRTDLHVTAYDPDEAVVALFRDRYARNGLYGHRVALHVGDALSVRLPPYIADVIVSEDPVAAGLSEPVAFMQSLYHVLRPYGGQAMLYTADPQALAALTAAAGAGIPSDGRWAMAEHGLAIQRPGALPGSADWTHQYGNAANSAYAADALVKAPLGLVWFGGPPNDKTLPRHLNGPIPQVAQGRLVMLGLNHLTARCVYTGREIWSAELPLIGTPFTSLEHEYLPAPVYFPNHPGANFIGSPYVSTSDSVYVIYEDRCLRLDMATGRTLATFDLPARNRLPHGQGAAAMAGLKLSYAAQASAGREQRWGHIAVAGPLLIAGAYPHMFDNRQPGRAGNWNATSSEYLVALDRKTGAIQWVHQARYGFRHNAIAATDDRVFAMDNISEEILALLRRRGVRPEASPEIIAFDAGTGVPAWRYDDQVFGTWLSYSAEHDVLLQAGRSGGRGALGDEPNDQLLALRGQDGAELWRHESRHTGPVALHDAERRIISGRNEDSLNLLTGEVYSTPHPITDAPETWRFDRTYGCVTQLVGRHLVTFRSGSAGYYDLARQGGTGNIGGVRSGCTSSLIPANGLMNVPDYTRTCSCSYQHQTSLALAHMPEVEMWTYSTYSDPEPGAIRQLGLNLGAPGSRMADDGVFWINHPSVPFVSAPALSVAVEFDGEPDWFHSHSLLVHAAPDVHDWVAASGARGLRAVRLDGLIRDRPSAYTLRLVFAEPDDVDVGERVFDIAIQGQLRADGFDIARRAGGVRRGVAAEFSGIVPDAEGRVSVTFEPHSGSRPPLLSGIAVRME